MTENKEPDMIIHNTYDTSILPPISNKKAMSKKSNLHADGTIGTIANISLTEENANKYGDITKIGWIPRMEHSIQMHDEQRRKEIAWQQHKTFARDPNRLLEVTISTIILAATNNKVPKEHLIYSLIYLKNIKDEFGDHPPNVSNFIKYLNNLKKQQEIEWEKSYYAEPEKPTHVTKMINPKRLSRIPRPIANSTFVEECQQNNKQDVKKQCKMLQAQLKKTACVDSKLNSVE